MTASYALQTAVTYLIKLKTAQKRTQVHILWPHIEKMRPILILRSIFHLEEKKIENSGIFMNEECIFISHMLFLALNILVNFKTMYLLDVI